jgi:hypothetical protein
MRLRMKGVVPIVIIVALVVLIAGSMLFKVKYEDSREQAAWDAVLQADQRTAAQARQALPLVAKYEELTKAAAPGSQEVQSVAQQIVELFPQFRAPAEGSAVLLIPPEKMKRLLTHYAQRG